VTGETCHILANAIERYSFIMRDFHRLARRIGQRNIEANRTTDPNFKGQIRALNVKLLTPCEEYPYFQMDESYNLTVDATSALTSSSEIRMNKTVIFDSPRYLHRGLLIDTSRHYISLSNIQKTLDAMAMNKMNVLHWHIVDDQSFPYQKNIKMIINYARDRGIRVVPEFDVPDLGPMNPIKNTTYNLLQELFTEIQDWFPDKFFHDGVPSDLGPMNPIKNTTYNLLQELFTEIQDWFPDKESNPVLKQYMKQKNMTSGTELHALFMSNVIPLLGHRSTPIVWQEVFDEKVPLSNDTLIQVLSAGYKLLYSSGWYLDHLQSGGDWEDFYRKDPRQLVAPFVNPTITLENIVGGEACMWGEVVNDMNIISRVWPRASAVAEKLWSPETNHYYRIAGSVYNRLEEHTCRMNRRGIRAEPPSGPGFCVGP
ncbi:Beta-hexosaminidase, partial [Operophtera brumata]